MKAPKDLTSGNIPKALVALTIPIFGSMVLESLYNFTDAVWIGHSGTIDLAAVNLSSFPFWMLFAFLGIITTGTNALVAQKLGEAKIDTAKEGEAAQVAALGLAVSVAAGAVLAAAVFVFGKEIFALMADDNEDIIAIIDLCYSYLAFLFLFAPLFAISECLSAILRAYGDSRTPLIVFGAGCVLNILLDPLFIFGWGPIPRLGVVGAALATNLGCLFSVLIYMWLLASGRMAFKLPKRPKRINADALKRIIYIGFPTSIASVVFSLVYMSLSPVIGDYGADAIAALGIGHRIEGLTYSVSFSVSLACITMAGQNIGARKLDRVRSTARWGVLMTIAANLPPALMFYFCPELLAKIFAYDAGVIEIAAGYLRIVSWSQIISGMGIVAEGIFSGSGKTLPIMLVSIPCSLLRVPLAYLCTYSFGMALLGIWWVICIMTIARGLLMFTFYKLNMWIPKELKELPAA